MHFRYIICRKRKKCAEKEAMRGWLRASAADRRNAIS